MGRVEEALGEADSPAELADKLDELVVGVGHRGAAYGRAVEEIEPYRFGSGGVQVDHVGPFEMGLGANESEQGIEGGLVESGFLLCVGRGDSAAYQVVGVAFEGVVDELGAKGFFVGA